MRNLSRLALVAVTLLASYLAPRVAQAQSVLFIGNSFTFADFGVQARPMGGVPELFARIARQDGHTPQVQMVAPGGTTMHQHFDNGHGEITAIKSKQWDYVVLQGYSSDATHAAPHSGEFLEYGKKIAEVIRQNNSATKIVLYETWAYPKGSQELAPFTNQAQMLDEIAANYRVLAREIGAVAVAPVGDAFFEAQNCPRHYDLYAPNLNKHSNDTGYLLSALVFVRTFYGQLPATIAPVLTDVSPEDTAWLASIAEANVRAWQHAMEPLKMPATP